MVIQCQQCETTYNFDEALLANGSVDVRCVRCNNVFTVSATPLQIEPAPTIQPEIPSTASVQAAPPIQPEEPALPDWNNDEDSFSFTESESFSFEENKEEQSTTPGQLDEGGQFSFESTTEKEDSLPQEFSFESIVPDRPVAPHQTGTPESGNSAPEPEVQDSATTEATDKAEKKSARPVKNKQKTSKLAWVFLLIIMLAAGVYGYCYVTFGTTDIMQMIQKIQHQLAPAPQQPHGSILVDTSESYYVDNAVAGQLFVIQGYAVNKFPGPRSEIKVAATLYKEKGVPLLTRGAYCGNIITKKELENLPLQELLETTNNPFGAALSNVSIAPGQSLPFMVVFADIPESLTEFSVEAESSKAAAK